ncbi:MAG: C25 family cysteine peptidase [Planctomycetota bacterium]|nr:C25 family cysteine peptidase [Planctomycetota bacterium]
MQNWILALICGFIAPGAAPDTLVICPPEFESALAPWVEYRTAQGHVVQVLPNQPTAEQTRSQIHTAAKRGGLKFVLLIGDAAPPGASTRTVARSVPARRLPTTVTRRWGSTTEMATDNWYADLDGDSAPELAIGRLTADTSAELTAMIGKIIAYEQNADFGPWRTRVNFVAGAGGFGPLADYAIEQIARSEIASHLPQHLTTTVTYASWQSSFCPDPRRFRDTVVERLSEGSLLWVYLGHGLPQQVAGTTLSERFLPQTIFHCDDIARLSPSKGSTIAAFLACSTGAYDQTRDCLAEQLLRSPVGPVAVLGGSRVTMPYSMWTLGSSLVDQMFEAQRPTLGEVFMHAKRDLAPIQRRSFTSAFVHCVSRAFQDMPSDLPIWAYSTWGYQAVRCIGALPADFQEERREHVSLFNLFGDPLMRMHYPKRFALTVSDSERVLSIQGRSPVSGAGRIEVLIPRHRSQRLANRPHYLPGEEFFRSFETTYRQANQSVIATATTTVTNGRVAARLQFPRDATGEYIVRVVVDGKSDFAIGHNSIQIGGPARRTASR